jgi:hypothetical protein
LVRCRKIRSCIIFELVSLIKRSRLCLQFDESCTCSVRQICAFCFGHCEKTGIRIKYILDYSKKYIYVWVILDDIVMILFFSINWSNSIIFFHVYINYLETECIEELIILFQNLNILVVLQYTTQFALYQ